MANRPIIPIKLTDIDKTIERFCIALSLGIAIGSILVYVKLPDTIPVHFNMQGEADRYGSKAVIFIFPVIALILYLVLTKLNKYPHIFNYPTEITPENAEVQYTLATRLVRYLKFGILLACTFELFDSIKRAAGGGSPGWLSLLVEVLFILGPVAYFLPKMLKAK